ncbi:hypothetical protein ACOME3_000475 [Neoechinorhynchus agilis]
MDEKQSRSVFVGNIPHGTTEDQMRDVFSVVGPVVSFRIVYDRETGNPKGYGFAEYQDAQTAQSAMRNLNGFEFNGRSLRVDKASSQADELRLMHQQSGGPPAEHVYGDALSLDETPEAISRIVSGLPPEQMFELMKQVKECVTRNPVQARMMLLQNPQLAYAILQAQVVMRIIDPQMAVSLLYQPPLDDGGEPNNQTGPPAPLVAPAGAKDASSTMAAMAAAAAAAAAAAGFVNTAGNTNPHDSVQPPGASNLMASSSSSNTGVSGESPQGVSAVKSSAAAMAAALGACPPVQPPFNPNQQMNFSNPCINQSIQNPPHLLPFPQSNMDDPNEIMMRYVNMNDQELSKLPQAQREAVGLLREQIGGRRPMPHTTMPTSNHGYGGRRM